VAGRVDDGPPANLQDKSRLLILRRWTGHVYEVTQESKWPATFRLCDNCVEVRKRSFGEDFLAVEKTTINQSTGHLNQRQAMAIS
jgi:hypothetical protein